MQPRNLSLSLPLSLPFSLSLSPALCPPFSLPLSLRVPVWLAARIEGLEEDAWGSPEEPKRALGSRAILPTRLPTLLPRDIRFAARDNSLAQPKAETKLNRETVKREREREKAKEEERNFFAKTLSSGCAARSEKARVSEVKSERNFRASCTHEIAVLEEKVTETLVERREGGREEV